MKFLLHLTFCAALIAITLCTDDEDCWEKCNYQAGSCSACGNEKVCCRNGWTDGDGCDGNIGCNDYHCCARRVPVKSAVNCEEGDKKTTIMIEVEFRQLPLKKASSYVKTTSSRKTFRSSYTEYAEARENYDSTDISAGASGSYGGFSASVEAAYASVTSSAESMLSNQGIEESEESFTETESRDEVEYFDNELICIRDIRTIVTIDGVMASTEEEVIKFVTDRDGRLQYNELEEMARQYITDHYGNEEKGEISGNGNIFTQSRCYSTSSGSAGAVDGGFDNWGAWSVCSVKCAGGQQSRTRNCNNPPPANGGRDCVGDYEQTQECNKGTCEVCAKTNTRLRNDIAWGYYNGMENCRLWCDRVADCGGITIGSQHGKMRCYIMSKYRMTEGYGKNWTSMFKSCWTSP